MQPAATLAVLVTLAAGTALPYDRGISTRHIYCQSSYLGLGSTGSPKSPANTRAMISETSSSNMASNAA